MKHYFVLVAVAILAVACTQPEPTPTPTATPPPTAVPAPTAMPSTNSNQEAMADDLITTQSGLQYRELVVGTGEAASVGDIAVVHYTGWLVDGTKFDSSVDRDSPFQFTIGTGGVIQGWDEGVALMRVGDKREFTIPSDLAYGDSGIGNIIPPGATLIFEVELLELR